MKGGKRAGATAAPPGLPALDLPALGPPALGKIAPETFERLIAPHLGAVRPEVLVGPRAGHDTAIVRVGAGRVLAITTDPLSVIPALGLEASARLACHLLASDLWTSGIPPAYATVGFDLPPDLDDEAFGRYWRAMSDAWAGLGVAVVAGHTGRYPAAPDPAASIIGAATVIGLGDEGRYLSPSMARTGDRVIVTKGCAIEATAIAAHLVPDRMTFALAEAGMSADEATAAVARARASLGDVSVVADCRALIAIGVRDRGVTALHDATEGGVLGGLLELARASGHDLRIERSRIPISAEARAACAALGGIDPYWTLSEGTLVAAVRPERAVEAVVALREAGIAAADVGEVVAGNGALWVTGADAAVTRIDRPDSDPYWAAYARATSDQPARDA
ncbi:MAG: AIR synthase [Candidatus Eisenbacteria bacterium]|nr:AIR synthase [Candidatus Eisenbacteria bacterium]